MLQWIYSILNTKQAWHQENTPVGKVSGGIPVRQQNDVMYQGIVVNASHTVEYC